MLFDLYSQICLSPQLFIPFGLSPQSPTVTAPLATRGAEIGCRSVRVAPLEARGAVERSETEGIYLFIFYPLRRHK